MDRIIKHNRIITSIFAVLVAFSSVILSVSNTYATISQSVEFVNSYNNNTFSFAYLGTESMTCSTNCTVSQNGYSDVPVTPSHIQINIPNQVYYTDGILRVDLTFHRVSNSTSLHGFFSSWYIQHNNFKLMSVDISSEDTNSFVASVYVRVISQGTANQFVIQSSNNSYLMVFQPSDRISLSSVSLWRTVGTPSNQDIINAINSQPNYTQNLNTINNNIQNVQDSVDDLSQTQQDIYDDEKDTINQHGDDASDLWEGTTFSLNFTDPFTTLWNLFTDSKCVDITTLANLVNAPQISTVCSPYPDGVKEIFSPCFNLFAVFFAVFFFIRWLSDSSGVVVNTFETVYTPTSIKTRRK